MVSAAAAQIDLRVRCLGLGADDFLTKPYDNRELVAHVKAVVRRANGHAQSEIRIGQLVVNLDTQSASVADMPLPLTRKEYCVLELLSLRKGIVVTKEAFLNHLYGGMDEPGIKIIDVFVCKLRQKLAEATGGRHYIKTVHGRGYTICDPAPVPAATLLGSEDDLGRSHAVPTSRDRARDNSVAAASHGELRLALSQSAALSGSKCGLRTRLPMMVARCICRGQIRDARLPGATSSQYRLVLPITLARADDVDPEDMPALISGLLVMGARYPLPPSKCSGYSSAQIRLPGTVEEMLNLSLLREAEYRPSKRPKNIADGGDRAIRMNASIWFGFAIAAAVLVAFL